ncbi:DUF4158 domain-containing protein [Nitrospira sp. M1]
MLVVAHTLRSSTNRVGFLLSCAYFRCDETLLLHPALSSARHRVYCPALGLSAQSVDLRRESKYTRIRHQQRIRAFYGFTLFDADAQKVLKAE